MLTSRVRASSQGTPSRRLATKALVCELNVGNKHSGLCSQTSPRRTHSPVHLPFSHSQRSPNKSINQNCRNGSTGGLSPREVATPRRSLETMTQATRSLELPSNQRVRTLTPPRADISPRKASMTPSRVRVCTQPDVRRASLDGKRPSRVLTTATSPSSVRVLPSTESGISTIGQAAFPFGSSTPSAGMPSWASAPSAQSIDISSAMLSSRTSPQKRPSSRSGFHGTASSPLLQARLDVSPRKTPPSRASFRGISPPPLQACLDASVPLSLDISTRSVSPRRVQAEPVFLQRAPSPRSGHFFSVGSVTVSPNLGSISAQNMRCGSPPPRSAGLKMCWQPGDISQAMGRSEAAVPRRCA